jgi:hypothetical protein
MTIRMLIERKKRRIMVVALVGFASAATGAVLTQSNVLNVEPQFAVLPGMVVVVLALLYANLFAFRCPRCECGWATLVMQGSRSLVGLDRRIRYCPFCGVDIDTELGAEQGRDDS